MDSEIKLVGTSYKDLDAITAQIKAIAQSINTKVSGPIPLPTRTLSQTVRKNMCSDGSHTFERWEMRVHKRMIILHGVNDQALTQVMRIKVPPDTVQIKINIT